MNNPTPLEVIARFGGTQAATAKALGISRAAVWRWVRNGRVPELWAYRIERGHFPQSGTQ